MADLDRIKRNVAKMAEQGAPEADIDGYIASEGTTVDAIRAHKPQSGPKYQFNPLESAIGGATQGYTMGTSDELAAAAGMGTQAQMQEKLRQAQEQNPMSYLGGEIAGGVASAMAGPLRAAGGAVSAGLKMMPKTAQWLSQVGQNAIARNAGISAASGVSGGVYGYATGTGSNEERLKNAATTGVTSAIAGPVVSSLASRAVNLFRKPVQQAVNQTQELAMSGRPVSELPAIPELAQKSDVLKLPKGAATGDVNVMRAEEAARQGMLTPELQSAMQQVDTRVKSQAQDVIQSLAGGQTESETALQGGIKKLQKAFESEKAIAGRLMDERNDAIASARIYKGYARDTLGAAMSELKKTPDFKVNISGQMGAPIREKFAYIEKALSKDKSGKFEKAIDFADLSAWRKSLNGFKAGSQEGVLAGQMAKKYDEWLDGITETALKEGDKSIVDKIFQANKFYKSFKDKFGTDAYSGQNKVIERILKQEELTPQQRTNLLFGDTVDGLDYTAQNLGRALSAVDDTAKAEMTQDFRAGLVLRAMEKASKKDGLSLPLLANNLLKMRKSEAYKMHLSTPEHDKVIDGLIKDIGKYVDATTRRDVYSPSGPMVVRFLQSVNSGLGTVFAPLGGRVVTEISGSALEKAAKASDKKIAEKTIKEFGEQMNNALRQMPKRYTAAITAPVAEKVGE